MRKAFFFAAALLCLGLPTAAQQNQSHAANAPARAENDANAPGENSLSSGDRREMSDILDRLSQSELRDQLASAIARVRAACADDIEELCGEVEPGQGRLASCVRENADDLSRRCRFTLFRTARRIRAAVANLASECASGIRAQCGSTDKPGDCAEQKSASISPACHTLVVALRHGGQRLSQLRDMDVTSSDGQDVGRVVAVQRGPNGQVEAVQIQVGRLLGIGDKVVTINADQLQRLGDRIKLQLSADQLRGLPEAKQQ
jgi:sporulation protein YlmC with PRC-barrel domain